MDLCVLTFAEVADVFWEFQMCTAQRGREETNRFEEGRVEAGDSAEDGVSQQLCRGQPRGEGITSSTLINKLTQLPYR